MQNLQDIVRSKVDEMRAVGYVDSLSRAEVVDALTATTINSVLRGNEEIHSGAIHMCPWHTCQATRHN
jgi:hypothetical protein